MSHNITARDKQQGVKQAWHGLTEVEDTIDVNNNWLTEWDIDRRGLYLPGGEPTEFDMIVATDDCMPIGRPMTKTYKPVTNATFLDLVRSAIDAIKGAEVVSVGSVCNRGRVFVTVKIKGHDTFQAGGRTFNDFLNFGNSHDQSSTIWVNNTNVCTVCDNTFTYNFRTGAVAKAVHRGNMDEKIVDMSKALDAYLGTQEHFRKQFDILHSQKINEGDTQRLFTGFVLRHKSMKDLEKGVSTRSTNRIGHLMDLFQNGAGNRGETVADAFSAVTDYYTHSSTRGFGADKAIQFVSSEFGIGRTGKIQFWDVVTQEDKFAETIERGARAIELTKVA
jgi:hypothetical protein